jgi:prepilin-type N-terminal cleavage/methylation domain-containing protein
MLKKNPSESKYGFTLLELLISSTMLAALFVFCLSFSNRLIKGYKAIREELHFSIEAQRILDLLENDLESAFIGTDTSFYIQYDAQASNPKPVLSFYSLLTDSLAAKESLKTGFGKITDSLWKISYTFLPEEILINNEPQPPGYYRQKLKIGCKPELNDRSSNLCLKFTESLIESSNYQIAYLKHCTFQFYIKDLKTGEIKPIESIQFNFPGPIETEYDPRQFKLAYVDVSLMLLTTDMNNRTPAMKTSGKQALEKQYTRRIIFWAEPFILPYECLVSGLSS